MAAPCILIPFCFVGSLLQGFQRSCDEASGGGWVVNTQAYVLIDYVDVVPQSTSFRLGEFSDDDSVCFCIPQALGNQSLFKCLAQFFSLSLGGITVVQAQSNKKGSRRDPFS